MLDIMVFFGVDGTVFFGVDGTTVFCGVEGAGEGDTTPVPRDEGISGPGEEVVEPIVPFSELRRRLAPCASTVHLCQCVSVRKWQGVGFAIIMSM